MTTTPTGYADGHDARERLGAVRTEVAKAVVGQDAAVSGLLVALLCGGHVLMEGVPGVAKTLLVRSLAAALSVQTRRVQFTPDLMPGDITGSMVIDSHRGELSFREGPVFTNLLLADEINRTPPKTQSALLEAMEEGQVSVDGVTHALPRPFLWRRRRTRSSTKAPTHSRRPSSTGSCSRSCCRSPTAPRSWRS
jgi:MoxR-like ATPase